MWIRPVQFKLINTLNVVTPPLDAVTDCTNVLKP